MRRQQEGGSGPATPTPATEPAPAPRAPEASLGARPERTDPPAPIVDKPPPAAPEPRPAPPPVAPTSAAPAPPLASAPVASPPVVVSPPIAPPPVASPPVASPPCGPFARADTGRGAPEAAPSPRTERPTQPPAPIVDVPPPSRRNRFCTPDLCSASGRRWPRLSNIVHACTVPTTTPAPQPVASAPPPSPSSAAVAGTAAPSATTSRPASGTPARPGTTQGSTLLQVAAVSDIARGRELQRQLHAAGMDAYWESVRTKQGTDVVRVRVTVDPATQSMAEAIAKLKALGFDPIIVTP